MKTKIISAFPGTGKSVYHSKHKETTLDNKKPKIDKERYEFNGKHWDYWSFFSNIRTDRDDNSFNIPEKDLIELNS